MERLFDLEEATIADLQEGMASGRLTATAIVERYLERIDAMDQRGPGLNQILEINPDALALAAALDAERKARGSRGALHGIPVLVKDNIATADRMTTTAGSLALAGSTAPRDAFIIQRLRAAGAIPLGKTNMSEWANFRSTRSSSGWSGRAGQGKNPYALDHSPSGSSSGSAASVAANFCAAAIGTETDGSIVSPSSANSVVGIKPTVGLVSRAGIIPIAHSQDTAGPIARTVRDAAILLGALTGRDPGDDATRASAGRAPDDYALCCDTGGLQGARIGVARESFFGRDPVVDRLIEAEIDRMRDMGAIIIDPANIETAGLFGDSEFEVMLYEFKDGLNRYLAGLGRDAPVRALRDVIEFNEAHRDEEMPYFGQEILLMAQEKGSLQSPAYRRALATNHRLARTLGIDAVMEQHRLDAIIGPTCGPPPPIDLVNGSPGVHGSSTPAAVAGYPHITVPAGYVSGLPVGISFMGRAYGEPTLIRLAYAYEQASEHRRPPQFRPQAQTG